MKFTISLLLILSITGINAQILNMESYRIKTDTTGWSGKLGMDFSLTKNTKTLTKLGMTAHVQYKTGKNLWLLLGQYSLLSSDNQTLIDKSILHLRYNYKFTPVLAGEWFIQGQKNSISKIDFRGLIGSGLRFKLSKNEKFKYYLGTAMMYEYEKTGLGNEKEFWRWSNYFSFSIYPTNTFSLISTTYYQPVITAFSNFRIASQNNLIFKITTNLAFKSGFNYNYDNAPVPGVPKEQYNLHSGILYFFK